MSLWDNIKETATDLAQAGVAQSKKLAEIAKLKTANMAEEDTIKKAYVELGKLYYAEKGAAPEGAYAAACEKITAARAAIETNNDRIAAVKAEPEPSEAVEQFKQTASEVADKVVETVNETVDEVKDALNDMKND